MQADQELTDKNKTSPEPEKRGVHKLWNRTIAVFSREELRELKIHELNAERLKDIHHRAKATISQLNERRALKWNIERKRMPDPQGAAPSARRYLPRRLFSGAAAASRWMREQRQLSRLSPRARRDFSASAPFQRRLSGSRSQLHQHLYDAWAAKIRGKPEALFRQALSRQALSRPQRVRALLRDLLGGMRKLFTAGAPLLVLWGIQQTPYALEMGMLTTFRIAGIAWAILHILLWIDPSVKDTIDVVNKLTGINLKG